MQNLDDLLSYFIAGETIVKSRKKDKLLDEAAVESW